MPAWLSCGRWALRCAAGAGIWAFLIYTDESRPQAARGILAGGLLTLVFLLRRYFFFFTVSFGLAALVALAVRRSQWKSFLTMAVTGVGFSLFFGQSFVVSQVLSSNYADTYSAYNQGRWIDLVMLCRYYGYIMIGVALVCGIALLLRAKSRYGALLCLCQPALCLFLFTRIQSHGQQHLLLYLPAFCFALAGGMELLPERRAVRWVPWALALCTLGSSFLPRVQPSHPSEIAVPDPLPAFTYVPSQRTDLAQLVALRVYVDGLSAQEQKTAAVIASSFTFNSSIYDNTLRSLDIPASGPTTAITYFATVDKRDGFSWNALTADYLIVAECRPTWVRRTSTSSPCWPSRCWTVRGSVPPMKSWTSPSPWRTGSPSTSTSAPGRSPRRSTRASPTPWWPCTRITPDCIRCPPGKRSSHKIKRMRRKLRRIRFIFN